MSMSAGRSVVASANLAPVRIVASLPPPLVERRYKRTWPTSRSLYGVVQEMRVTAALRLAAPASAALGSRPVAPHGADPAPCRARGDGCEPAPERRSRLP